MAGEITTRRLEALLDGLPEDNAITRAVNDGRAWGTTHALLWQVLGTLVNIAGLIRAALQIKTNTFKWPVDPWTKVDDGKTIGRVDKDDQVDAISYLSQMYD